MLSAADLAATWQRSSDAGTRPAGENTSAATQLLTGCIHEGVGWRGSVDAVNTDSARVPDTRDPSAGTHLRRGVTAERDRSSRDRYALTTLLLAVGEAAAPAGTRYG